MKTYTASCSLRSTVYTSTFTTMRQAEQWLADMVNRYPGLDTATVTVA